MITGMDEVIERWKDQAYYIFIEKYPRDVVFEGFLTDAKCFECEGFKTADEIYIGDGILRVVIIEENLV